MSRNLLSPYKIADPKEAFKVFKTMPHCSVEGYVMPSYAQFKKTHKVKFAASEVSKPAPEPVSAETVGGTLVEFGGVVYSRQDDGTLIPATTKDSASIKGEYATPLDTDEVKALYPDAASNAVLWRLNVQGYLVFDPTGGNTPIEQASSKVHLTAVFGPQ